MFSFICGGQFQKINIYTNTNMNIYIYAHIACFQKLDYLREWGRRDDRD
jgi:hypothetical protein